MTIAALVIDVAVVGVLSAFLLHRYGNWRKQHVLVTLATFIAWYFSFMIIFVLPIDVSNTCYRQCLKDNKEQIAASTIAMIEVNITHGNNTTVPFSEALETTTAVVNGSTTLAERVIARSIPLDSEVICKKSWSHVPPDILPNLWHVVYWTSQALTWLILPIMQSYATAGDFTILGKTKTALIANALYYSSYLLIFIVCLVYVAVKPNLHINGAQLKVLAVTASNTWGLFLLVLLLGYGLVEVPRSLWNASKRGHTLAYTYFKIAKLSVEKSEAEEALEDVMDDVKKAAETIKYNHAFRKHVETIVEKCPESVQTSVRQNRDDFEDYNNPTETPTEKSLVRLHVKVIKTTQTFTRTQVQWAALTEKAFDLEDIEKNESSAQHSFQRSYGHYTGVLASCYTPTFEWYWKCWLCPWVLRIACISMALMSVMLVWSECLFFIQSPVLSLFALFVDLARQHQNYLALEFVSFITIIFISVSAYFTIFRIRLFNLYYLASRHQTNEYSLIFAGMLLCRLTPPLCLNFLGLIHLDSHVTRKDAVEETDYTKIMGHMDVIPFISDGFNIYFPMLIVLLCIATYFNLCGRCLHFLGFQQYIGTDDLTQELVDEGRELIRREHRKKQRQEEGDARRQDWQEKYGDRNRSSVKDNVTSRRPASQAKVAKSPVENDRTELLKEDYTAQRYDPFRDEEASYPGSSTSSYQSKPATYAGPPRPTSFGAPRQSSAPPKGIFDDI